MDDFEPAFSSDVAATYDSELRGDEDAAADFLAARADGAVRPSSSRPVPAESRSR